jgi:hypothetical protein
MTVPFVDSEGTSTFVSVADVTDHAVTVAFNSCLLSCAQAKPSTWQMHYSHGQFVLDDSLAMCAGEPLAFASHTYDRAHGDGTAADNAIYNWSCADGYAEAAATDYNGGWGIAYRLKGGAWSVIDVDNIILAQVFPASVYRLLAKSWQRKDTYFPY